MMNVVMEIDRLSSAEAVGLRVWRLRKAHDLSQRELASICGVTPAAVGNWEQGTARPTYEQLEKLARRFSVTTDYIILGRLDLLPYDLVQRLEKVTRARRSRS